MCKGITFSLLRCKRISEEEYCYQHSLNNLGKLLSIDDGSYTEELFTQEIYPLRILFLKALEYGSSSSAKKALSLYIYAFNLRDVLLMILQRDDYLEISRSIYLDKPTLIQYLKIYSEADSPSVDIYRKYLNLYLQTTDSLYYKRYYDAGTMEPILRELLHEEYPDLENDLVSRWEI